MAIKVLGQEPITVTDLANYSKVRDQVREQHGSITAEQIRIVAKVKPFFQLLVRCGNGRFVTAAQSITWFVECINDSGKDYVRDVSLLAGTEL